METFYDRYNFPDGGEKRKDCWKKHLAKHLDFDSLKNKTVLDVGCGTGTMSKILYGAGADIYAIDLSRKSIESVNKAYPEIKAKVGDALHLDFPDNHFDIVISIGVLHHTPDTHKGFEECVRVTKSKGQCIIMLYSKWHYYPLIYKSFKLFRQNKKPEDMPRWFIKSIKRFTEFYYKEPRDDQDAVHLIADQLFTPIAKFHSEFEIKKYIREMECELISTSTTFLGQHKIYNLLKKKG